MKVQPVKWYDDGDAEGRLGLETVVAIVSIISFQPVVTNISSYH